MAGWRSQGHSSVQRPHRSFCNHTGCESQPGSQAPSSPEFSRSVRTPCLAARLQHATPLPKALRIPVPLCSSVGHPSQHPGLQCQLSTRSLPGPWSHSPGQETTPTTVWEVKLRLGELEGKTPLPSQPGGLREGLSCSACLEEGTLCTVGLKAEAVSLLPLMPTRAWVSALTKEASHRHVDKIARGLRCPLCEMGESLVLAEPYGVVSEERNGWEALWHLTQTAVTVCVCQGVWPKDGDPQEPPGS